MTYARFRCVLASICLLAIAIPASAAADEFDMDEDQGYPMELVRRPLVLRSGMLEVLAGGRSDFVAASSVKSDAILSRLNVLYSPFTRGQVGLETVMSVAGGNSFQIDDAAGWVEYNVHPTMSLRFGGYMMMPNEGDTLFGVRVGAPMKWRSGKAAVTAMPRWGMELNGPGLQYADLPIGGQYQVMPQLAIFATTGLVVVDWKFEEGTMGIPLSAGLVVHPTARFDIGAEFTVADVSDSFGRDSRWLGAWFALRR